MTAALEPVANLTRRVEDLELARTTYRKHTVLAVYPLTSTYDADVEGVGRVDGFSAPAHFLPKVGDVFNIPLKGSVPGFEPNRIAPGAVGEEELSPEVTENIAVAMDAANGKNKVTFSNDGPTPITPGVVAGDIWFQRDVFGLGIIVASWEWTGNAWSPKFFGDSVLNSLTVGKLVGGTVTADMIVGGRIASANTGQRYEMNALAIQGFNGSNTLTLNFDGVNNLMTGQIRSASIGERLIINPNGNNPSRLDFYPATGTQFASIEAETISGQAAVLLTANNASTTTKSGVVAVRRSFAHIGFGTRGLAFDSSIYADTSTVRTASQIIDLQYIVGQGTGGGPRIAMGAQGVPSTQLNVWTTANGQPWIHAVNQDVGFFFFDGIMNIVGNTISQRRDLNVGSVFYTGSLTFASSEKVKTDVADFTAVDMRAATRKARIKKFRMPHRDEPPRPADGEFGETAGRVAPVQIGFKAEEMPEAVQAIIPAAINGEDVLGLDHTGIVALLWHGLGRAYDDIDELRAELAALRGTPPTAGPKGIK